MTAMTVAPARQLRPRGTHQPVRLTRRGRLSVVLSVLVLCAVGFSFGGGSTIRAASSVHHSRPAVVTVQTGESLWQLATRVAPHADPRLVVSEIERLNGLSGATVYAGQQLQVPRYR
jgi:hypothetical protein